MSITTDTRRPCPPAPGRWIRSIRRSASRSTTWPARSAGSSARSTAKLDADERHAGADRLGQGRKRGCQGREPGRPPSVPGFLRRRALSGAQLRVQSRSISRGDQVDRPRRASRSRVSTKPVELTGTIAGPITDYTGNASASGCSSTRRSTAREFGVNWNVPLPTGSRPWPNEVKLSAELYFVREA